MRMNEVEGHQDSHEWISLPDPEEERTWVFDVTFLLSSWRCIYGQGCQGVLTAPAPELEQGCCSYGAHFTDSADRKRVERAASRLDPDRWQFHRQGKRSISKKNDDGEWVTRIVDGACIFLNRPGFPAGPGCALHQAALADGAAPHTVKPDVCWQLPLRRDEHAADDGSVTSVIGQWDRRHWGAGGEEFAWWCTEAPEAFRADSCDTGEGTARNLDPVYVTMRDELTALTGKQVYDELAHYLDWRARTGTALPHPTLRARGSRAAGKQTKDA